MVNFIKKHKILSGIVGFILLCFIFILVASSSSSETTSNKDSMTPEPLTAFVGYWQSNKVYFYFKDNLSFTAAVDDGENTLLSDGTFIDQTNGGDMYFDAGFSWDCKCYKQDNNNAVFSYTLDTDTEVHDISLVRINENTFNEAKSKVEAYLADKGNTNSTDTNQTENTTTGYKSGTYKVGTDMPAGEYVLTNTSKDGYVQISSDSSGQIDSEYVKLGNGVTATPIDEFNTSEMPSLLEGTYKVGRDLPAGEYQVTTSGGSGYWERSSGAVSSDSEILANENFQNSTYVTVNEGEYLKLSNGATLVKE